MKALMPISGSQPYRAVVIRVVILIVLAAMQPWLWSQVHVRAKDFQAKQSQSQQMTAVDKLNASMTADLSQQAASLKQIDTVVLPQADISDVVSQLEQLADRGRLVINVTGIDDGTDKKSKAATGANGIVPVTITAKVSGTADAIFNFFESLEYSPPLLIIKQWQVAAGALAATAPSAPAVLTPGGSPRPSVSPVPQYTLTFTIIYYLKADK